MSTAPQKTPVHRVTGGRRPAKTPDPETASAKMRGRGRQQGDPRRLGDVVTGDVLRDPAERVSPRARWMWLLGSLAAGLVLMAVATPVALLALDLPGWALLPVSAAVAAYCLVVPQWRYLVHRWEVTDTAVYTQTGWWARERRIAPMSRIQTVDYAQSALARLFGLASVTVTTASAAGALEIAGLDARRAQALAEELTRKAHAVPGDAT